MKKQFIIENKNQSLSTLLFFSFLLIDINLRRRNSIDESIDLQIILKTSIFLILLFISCLNINEIIKNNTSTFKYLIYYSTFCLFSSIYSPNTLYTLVVSTILMSMCLYSCLIVNKIDFAAYLKIGHGSLLLFLVLSWLAYLLFPEIGTLTNYLQHSTISRMTGVSVHPNGLGIICVLLFIHNIYYRKIYGDSRINLIIQLTIFTLTTVTAYLTASRTSLALICIIIYYIQLRQNLLKTFLLSIIPFTFIIMYLLNVDLVSLVSRDGDTSDVTSVAGRTTIWNFVATKVIESPLLGFGYGSSKYIMNLGIASELDASHAHNMLLQCLLSIGLVGTLPLVIILISQIKLLVQKPFLFRDLITIVIIVLGLTESSIVNIGILTFIWIISILIKPTIFFPVLKRK